MECHSQPQSWFNGKQGPIRWAWLVSKMVMSHFHDCWRKSSPQFCLTLRYSNLTIWRNGFRSSLEQLDLPDIVSLPNRDWTEIPWICIIPYVPYLWISCSFCYLPKVCLPNLWGWSPTKKIREIDIEIYILSGLRTCLERTSKSIGFFDCQKVYPPETNSLPLKINGWSRWIFPCGAKNLFSWVNCQFQGVYPLKKTRKWWGRKTIWFPFGAHFSGAIYIKFLECLTKQRVYPCSPPPFCGSRRLRDSFQRMTVNQWYLIFFNGSCSFCRFLGGCDSCFFLWDCRNGPNFFYH